MNNAYSCYLGGGHNQVQGCTEDRTPSGHQKDEEELRGRSGRKPRTQGDPQLDKFKENSWSQKSQGEGGIIRDLLAFKGEQKRSQPPDPWLKARPSLDYLQKAKTVKLRQIRDLGLNLGLYS